MLFLLWALLLTPPAVADDERPARLSLFVFERGRPVEGLTVRLGETTGRTDGDGAWRAEVPAQAQRMTVFDTATPLLALPVTPQPGEVVQYIVTLTGEERSAQVSIESSHQGGATPAQTGPSAPEAEGSGILAGRVTSSESGEAIAGARIFISGTPLETRSGEDGTFRIEVSTGDYAVSVLHSDFATRTIEGVQIAAERETQRDFELPPAGLELAEYVVVQPYIEGSLTSIIDEQRQSASVANVLGAEQISRAGDSDAGSALARVTGLTLVDGQFIYVRGLGERYSSTLLNGASVPSPDPTRKVVPLNLFPTGVISSIRVQKGFSPEMPGDFGGGTVEIRTRGIPEEDFFSVGLSMGYREGTTFEKGLTYDGGDSDWTGYDDGLRELPSEVREVTGDDAQLPPVAGPFNPDGLTPEELEMLGESFPNIYDIDRKRTGPDRGLSIEGGKLFDINSDWTAGVTAAAMWDDSWQTRSETRNSFIPLGDGSLRSNDSYTIDRTTREINLTGFATAGVNYRDRHKLNVTSMMLRQSEDETSSQFGFNLDEDGDILINQLEWEERQLVANQFEGEHVIPFLNETKLKWDYSTSRADLEVPDLRRYRYDPDSDGSLIFSRRSDNNVRRFAELTDDAEDYGLDLEVPFGFSWLSGTLSGGWRETERSRDSSIRRFRFTRTSRLSEEQRRELSLENIFNPDNIGPDGVVLAETTRDTDNYTAGLDIESVYGNLDFTIADALRISGGARIEDWSQNVTTFALFDPDNLPVISDLSNKDVLPALAATWYITERQQVRASYAETLIRPDFKELSPAPFTDPVLNREVIGNAELVQSGVTHYDLRYEFYPSESEILSLGIFYKLIENPIELTVESGVEQRLTYMNAEEAENFGVEVEGRMQLGFIDRWFGGSGFWERFHAAGNVAWIDSEITIGDGENQGILTSASRELQGQSPLVANLQLGYDDPDHGLTATLLYNHVGKRIAEVGVLGAPDKYEQANNQLDFNIAWAWKDYLTFKLKLKNLLDEQFEVTQGPEVVQRYKKGRQASIGIDLDF